MSSPTSGRALWLAARSNSTANSITWRAIEFLIAGRSAPRVRRLSGCRFTDLGKHRSNIGQLHGFSIRVRFIPVAKPLDTIKCVPVVVNTDPSVKRPEEEM